MGGAERGKGGRSMVAGWDKAGRCVGVAGRDGQNVENLALDLRED